MGSCLASHRGAMVSLTLFPALAGTVTVSLLGNTNRTDVAYFWYWKAKMKIRTRWIEWWANENPILSGENDSNQCCWVHCKDIIFQGIDQRFFREMTRDSVLLALGENMKQKTGYLLVSSHFASISLLIFYKKRLLLASINCFHTCDKAYIGLGALQAIMGVFSKLNYKRHFFYQIGQVFRSFNETHCTPKLYFIISDIF